MRKHGSRFFLKAISVLGIAVLALSACGGGGSDTPPTPPSSPANLTADAGDSQVVLNWPSVSGAATYNVYYGTSTPVTKSSTKITGSVSGPKTVTGLTNDTPYFFAVSAVNANGESSLSVERSATPSATPPPGAPTNIRASAGDTQVTVSWDSVTGATSYNIYYGTATGVTKASTKITDVTSPHAKTELLNGTTYFFVVTAENGNGESGASFEVSAKPMATPPPAAPSLTSATAGNATVTLTWSSVAGATSYNIYHGTASGVTKASGTKVTGVTSPYDVTGLTNGTTYFFVVAAQDANGESAESNERSATPTAPPAAFNQADLTGTWRMNLLKNGTDTEWDRARISINSSGVATCLSVDGSFAGGNTCPSPFDLTFTMNTTTGVITQSGDHAVGDGGHMTMTSNKNFVVGTGTNGNSPNFSYQLMIAQKEVSGTSYIAADVQNKSFVYHTLQVGATNKWQYGTGSTDSTGAINISSETDALNGITTPGNVGTISVDSNGVVTMSPDMDTYQGFLSADKKTIVGTVTEDGTKYRLMIIQISGQTYAAEDLVGTSRMHMLDVGNANFWAHYTATGVGGGGVTFSSWVDSSGGTAPSDVTASITSSGTITLIQNPSFHGTMSYDKKFTVATQTNGAGIYSLSVMTQ